MGDKVAPAILVLNGPNLNLLGSREPEIYGTTTLVDITTMLEVQARQLGCTVDVRQSNHEGVLIDWLHGAVAGYAAILLNAGALTHTSLALYDAIKSISVPVLEIHLSNPYAREEFRRKSVIAPAVRGVICGFGAQSYRLGLEAAMALVKG